MDLADGIDDENGDDALEEPEGAAPEGAESAAAGGETNGESHDGSRRRRRRRRGRRGRGRARDQAVVAEGANGNGASAPPRAPASETHDETYVPRGVVSHELMPAATGGRRRGRRGGRGRRGFGAVEPADPQLISPQNPVPKPGFDED